MNTNRLSILPIVGLIAVVNAIGYGVIIPVLYTYTKTYGLSDVGNGMLFSVFSLCQFLATPIIGRMSDAWGRKPLLIMSLLGSAISFFMMAFSPNIFILFLARALDGLTAGNIPVISAVISDSTDQKNRAKGFGILGASFGLGFVLGPAISAATLRFGLHVPFVIAGIIAGIAAILTITLLPETNAHEQEVAKAPLFDLPHMARAVLDPDVGSLLAMSLLYMMSFSLYTFAFQPYAVTTLHMPVEQIAMLFGMIGVVGLIAQGGILPIVSKRVPERMMLVVALGLCVITFLLLSLPVPLSLFMVFVVVHAVGNSFVNPMIQTIISKETDVRSQGSIMGLNTSYSSIGMILGPIIGGVLTSYSVHAPFVAASVIVMVCGYLALHIHRVHRKKVSAF